MISEVWRLEFQNNVRQIAKRIHTKRTFCFLFESINGSVLYVVVLDTSGATKTQHKAAVSQ